MARLGGWKRTGIIASVVWILGAGISSYVGVEKLEREEFNAKWDDAWNTYLMFQRYHALPKGFTPTAMCEDCRLLEEQFHTNYTRVALRASAAFTFTILALGWALAYLVLFLVNWVKRGFISPGNSN
jgi:hypothetical protein